VRAFRSPPRCGCEPGRRHCHRVRHSADPEPAAMPVIALALFLLPGTAAAHGLLEGHLHLSERVPLFLSAILLGSAWLLYGMGCRKVRPHGREALWMHLAMVITLFAV